MTTWTEMTAIEFDAKLAPTRKARQFVETAPETLFPRLLPEGSHQSPAAVYWGRIGEGQPGVTTDPCGTPDMFGTEEL